MNLNDKTYRNVLHLRSSGGVLGAESVIVEVAKHSKLYGYDSIIGAIKDVSDPDPDFLTLAREYNISTIIFEAKRKIDISCSSQIKAFVLKNNVSLLHCHGYKENFYGLLSQCGIPKVATNHLWKVGRVKSNIYCAIDALLIRHFDQVIGVSNEIVNQMSKLLITNTIKIPNGVDINQFHPSEKDKSLMQLYGIREEDITLGMVSSLTPIKNHSIVLDALAALKNPKLKLLIAGDGKLRTELEQKALSYNLQDQVRFLGRQTQVNNLLSIIDIFLLPSLAEGLPIALLEAMACGKAAIASRVGEIGSVLRHNENGLLFDPNDTSAIINNINTLLLDNNRITALGRAARDTVVNDYSSSAMSRNYCLVYDRLVG